MILYPDTIIEEDLIKGFGLIISNMKFSIKQLIEQLFEMRNKNVPKWEDKNNYLCDVLSKIVSFHITGSINTNYNWGINESLANIGWCLKDSSNWIIKHWSMEGFKKRGEFELLSRKNIKSLKLKIPNHFPRLKLTYLEKPDIFISHKYGSNNNDWIYTSGIHRAGWTTGFKRCFCGGCNRRETPGVSSSS